MSDCANVEIRELLPGYAGGLLAPAARARVSAHLALCDECRAELALLESVREAYAWRGPAMDVAAIVRALPRPPRRATFRSGRLLQIAAAISFISLGGISLAVARSFFDGAPPPVLGDSTLPNRDSGAAGRSDGLGAAAGATAPMPGISFGGGVGDLAPEDLETLLAGIESLEALPPVDVDEPQVDTGRSRTGTSEES